LNKSTFTTIYIYLILEKTMSQPFFTTPSPEAQNFGNFITCILQP